MQSVHSNAPTPDLRIILIDSIHPHEEYDSQRSEPLIERLREEKYVINPPIVAPMGASQYVIMDGANRCHSLAHLGYPHILVQVVSYDSGYVELDVWNHVISKWTAEALLDQLTTLPDITLAAGQHAQAIAHFLLRDGRVFAVLAPVENTHERNAALRNVVGIYQRSAVLNRTALQEPDDVWPLYPDAIAMVVFPRYQPADIIAAAKYKAYLPPGISRHIVHGRALRVNYPLEKLLDISVGLYEKNQDLKVWLQDKLAKRQIRYYAEAIYQFDE